MENMEKSPLRLAERELEVAQKAIFRMEQSKSLEEFEDEWRIYLNAIEKCWVKTERICQPFEKKFLPWQGKYTKLRKSDPLLKYLYHARHTDQHTIQEMVEPKNAESYVQIGGRGRDGYIAELCTGANGEITSYIGTSPIEYFFLPKRIELIPVLSSKKWYQPPHKHLDNEIFWPAPGTVAELGIIFYRNFLDEVQKKFFKEPINNKPSN